MCWEVIAAIASSATFILSIALFILVPIIQRHVRSKPLSLIIELKDKAIKIQNQYNRILTKEELDEFKKEVDNLKVELLAEISKISKYRAKQYNMWGEVNTYLFRKINNEEQLIYLGVINSCWKLADNIIEKYS